MNPGINPEINPMAIIKSLFISLLLIIAAIAISVLLGIVAINLTPCSDNFEGRCGYFAFYVALYGCTVLSIVLSIAFIVLNARRLARKKRTKPSHSSQPRHRHR